MFLKIVEVKIDGKYKYVVLNKDNLGTDKEQLMYQTDTSDFENKDEIFLDALEYCKYAQATGDGRFQ